MTATLFEREGDTWRPTTAALAVWHCSIHPAAVAALIAAEVEDFAATQGMQRMNISFALGEPVLEGPLEVRVWGGRRYPPGRFVEGELRRGDRRVVRFSGCIVEDEDPLRLIEMPEGEPDSVVRAESSLVAAIYASGGLKDLRSDGIEHRARVRRCRETGRDFWLDLPVDLAPGRPLTAAMKIAACAGLAPDLMLHDQFVELLRLRKQSISLGFTTYGVPSHGPVAMMQRRGPRPLPGHVEASASCSQPGGRVGHVNARASSEWFAVH